MLNIGMSEIFLFAVIALIVLGPDKLPVALKFAAKWYVKIKNFITNIQNDIEKELNISELKAQMQNELKRIEVLEKQMAEKFAVLEKQQQILFENSKHTTPIIYQFVAPACLIPYQFDYLHCQHVINPPLLIEPQLKVAV